MRPNARISATTAAVYLTLRRNVQSTAVAVSTRLISTLHHNAVHILGIVRAGDRRPVAMQASNTSAVAGQAYAYHTRYCIGLLYRVTSRVRLCRACHGPAPVGRRGVGPGRPINFSCDGPRPGPTHQSWRGWAAARSMTLAARPVIQGLYTGWTAISVGRPVDLTGRATGRPLCCPVLKNVKAYVLTYFFFVLVLL